MNIEGYKVLSLIGSGGSGQVHLCRDNHTGENVAIKTLSFESSLNQDQIEGFQRFSDEASAAGKIDSRYVVKTKGHGYLESGCPYIIYEYLDGGNLQEHFNQGKTWTYPKARTEIIVPLLKGLSAAHKTGIIHRDIKPENLFRSPEGFFKIGDCGLATFAHRNAKTKTGMIVGTPLYMAPERLSRVQIPEGPYTDIYSAGLIIIKALTGKLPAVTGGTHSSALQFILRITREDLEKCGLPRALIPVLYKSVCEDPLERYKTADEFLYALPQSINTSSTHNKPGADSLKNAPRSENGTITSKVRTSQIQKRPMSVVSSARKPLFSRRVLVISLFILSTGLILLAVFQKKFTATNNDAHTNDIAWLQKHKDRSALYEKALSFCGKNTPVSIFNDFALTEKSLWDEQKSPEQKHTHLIELSNIEKSLKDDPLFQKLIKSRYLLRRNHQQDAIRALKSAFEAIIKNDYPEHGETDNDEADHTQKLIHEVQLANYVYKELLCLITDSQIHDSETIIESVSRRFYSFLVNRKKPSSKLLINSITCGRHLVFLWRALTERTRDEITLKTTRKAIDVAMHIPPYEPLETFGVDFFTRFTQALKRDVPCTSVSPEEFSQRVIQLNGEGFIDLGNGRGKYSLYRGKRKRFFSIAKLEHMGVQETDEKSVTDIFLNFERCFWQVYCANELYPFSPFIQFTLNQTYEEIAAFDKGIKTVPGYKSGIPENFHEAPKDMQWPHLEENYLSLLKEILETGKGVPEQKQVLESLTELYSYSYTFNGSSVSSIFAKCMEDWKEDFPLVYWPAIEFCRNDATASMDSRQMDALVKELFTSCSLKSLDEELADFINVRFPRSWFGLAGIVFSTKWSRMMKDSSFDERRLFEADRMIKLIDLNAKDSIQRTVDFMGSDISDAKDLLTIALTHRADAFLALGRPFTREIINDFKRFPSNDPRETELWKRQLLSGQRISPISLHMKPSDVKASLLKEEMH